MSSFGPPRRSAQASVIWMVCITDVEALRKDGSRLFSKGEELIDSVSLYTTLKLAIAAAKKLDAVLLETRVANNESVDPVARFRESAPQYIVTRVPVNMGPGWSLVFGDRYEDPHRIDNGIVVNIY